MLWIGWYICVFLKGQLTRKEAECVQLTEERYALESEKLDYMRQVSRLQMEKVSLLLYLFSQY